MSQRLPLDHASCQRIGSCIGDVVHTDSNRDVGFCILWNDGNYEICLDSNTHLDSLSVLFVRPRPQHTSLNRSVSESNNQKIPQCVGELRNQGALVSVLEHE